MAQIADGGSRTTAYTPPVVPRAALPPRPTYTPPPQPAQTASTSFVRRPVTAPTPAPPPAPTPAPAPTQTLDQRLYQLPQYGAPPAVPSEQQYSVFGEPIDLEGPIGLSFADQPLGQSPYQDERQYNLSRFDSQGGVPQLPSGTGGDPYLQNLAQLGVSLPSQPQGQTEQQLITDAARWTGQAIFQYGALPNVISTVVANELPYTYYGYSSADQLLEDLGYFEQSPGQWIQGDPGATTTSSGFASNSGTQSYASGGGGYAGRYAGASTGLINWRMGF